MTQLERATKKLERIKTESNELEQSIRKEHKAIPLGQPNIVGRSDIYKGVKRKYEKQRKLYEEEKKQQNRVEMLEKVEEFKSENELAKDVHVVGKSSYATVGVKTSVNNLEYFKNKLIDLEKQNEEAKAFNKTKPDRLMKTYGTDITKLKRKIANLEAMLEKNDKQVLSEKTKELIENGSVNQWKKKPIYYFVKGLKKVALEIDEQGNFFISKRYYASNDSDKDFVENLLK